MSPSAPASPPPSSRSRTRGLVAFRLVAADPSGVVTRMTLHRATDTIELAVTRDASGRPWVLEAAFDSGEATVVAQLYAVDAAEHEHPAEDGVFAGPEWTPAVRLRHHRVAGDIGLLVVEWSAADTPDGTETQVVRRGSDGRWRYAVSGPFA